MNPEIREKLLKVLKNSAIANSISNRGFTHLSEIINIQEYNKLWVECIKYLENPEIKYEIVKKSSTKEWIVRKYIGGKLDKDSDYYTDDKQDAIDTKDFAEQALKAGETTI